MTEHVPITDVVDAARLIALGMRPRLLPARDLIYSDLVRRYGEDATFAELTSAIVDGLGWSCSRAARRPGWCWRRPTSRRSP